MRKWKGLDSLDNERMESIIFKSFWRLLYITTGHPGCFFLPRSFLQCTFLAFKTKRRKKNHQAPKKRKG